MVELGDDVGEFELGGGVGDTELESGYALSGSTGGAKGFLKVAPPVEVGGIGGTSGGKSTKASKELKVLVLDPKDGGLKAMCLGIKKGGRF